MNAHQLVVRAGGLAALLSILLAGCAGPGAAPTDPVTQPWAWEMPRCTAYQPAALSAPAHRVSASVDARDGGEATEQVDVYEAGWGPRAMAQIRSVLRECASHEYGGMGDPAAFLEQHLVIGTGFAGDESLLVETVHLSPPEPPRTRFAAVVRRGDVVTTLRTTGWGADWTRCLAGAQDATCP